MAARQRAANVLKFKEIKGEKSTNGYVFNFYRRSFNQ